MTRSITFFVRKAPLLFEEGMRLMNRIQKVLDGLWELRRLPNLLEAQILLQGRVLSEALRNKHPIDSLKEVEFKAFSQFGDDGIIQWLIHHLDIPKPTFIEFGVGDYHESNTRFLLMNNNWSGFIMDGSAKNVSRIRRAEYYWRYDLTAKTVFVDQENINAILADLPFGAEVGLLHIDLDGMDYWIWNAIQSVTPVILILEYNSVFGQERAVTVPYRRDFQRSLAHSSNLYWGASLRALHSLSERKGFAFVGCNSAGNNAYFVRRDKLNNTVRDIPLESGYVESKFRESRDSQGNMTYLVGEDRIKQLRGMPVYNVNSGQMETL